MIYSSKTPRDLNSDPKPYYDIDSQRRYSQAYAGTDYYLRYEPRRGFDGVQHNAPNPLLVAYRKDKVNGNVGYSIEGLRPTRLQHWLSQISTADIGAVVIGTGVQCSADQANHARKVLTRLVDMGKV